MTPDEVDRNQTIDVVAEALQAHAAKFHHDASAILCLSRARAVIDALAPLLVDARQSGKEQGWDACFIEYQSASGDPDSANPYRH